MIKVGVVGKRSNIKRTISKLARCTGCEYLHENGNCLKVGGYFSSVDDKNCPKQNTADKF